MKLFVYKQMYYKMNIFLIDLKNDYMYLERKIEK